MYGSCVWFRDFIFPSLLHLVGGCLTLILWRADLDNGRALPQSRAAAVACADSLAKAEPSTPQGLASCPATQRLDREPRSI